MEMIFRSYDNKEFQTFDDCFNYEVASLGVIFLDDDFRVTDDFEKVYYIYVPRAKDAEIIIGYADTEQLDASMWRFGSDLQYFNGNDPVLFHWNSCENFYEAFSYADISKLVEVINECQTNKDRIGYIFL